MKLKTSELTERQIDWTVAMLTHRVELAQQVVDRPMSYGYSPSKHWVSGGPLIEENRIWVIERYPDVWDAFKKIPYEKLWGDTLVLTGHTYLVAAMRCYIASRWGGVIDIPEELV
jgi:hypothetical protein